jgi:hypothetical protein
MLDHRRALDVVAVRAPEQRCRPEILGACKADSARSAGSSCCHPDASPESFNASMSGTNGDVARFAGGGQAPRSSDAPRARHAEVFSANSLKTCRPLKRCASSTAQGGHSSTARRPASPKTSGVFPLPALLPVRSSAPRSPAREAGLSRKINQLIQPLHQHAKITS